MARTSDTAERTVAAAWVLLADGVYPSAQTIRDQIRHGSMTTINQALKHDFWPAVSKRMRQPELPGPLVDLTQQLWQKALESADETLAHYRREVDSRLAVLESERQAALDQLHDLQRGVTEKAEQIKRLQDDKAAADQALATEREQHRIADRQRVEVTEHLRLLQSTSQQREEQRRTELATEKRRIDEIEHRLTRLYDDQKTARERLEQQLFQQVKASGEQHDALRADLTQQAQRTAALRDALTEQQAACRASEARCEVLIVKQEQVERDLAKAQQVAKAAAARRQALGEELDDLRARLQTAALAQASAERENQVLTTQLKLLSQRIGAASSPINPSRQ